MLGSLGNTNDSVPPLRRSNVGAVCFARCFLFSPATSALTVTGGTALCRHRCCGAVQLLTAVASLRFGIVKTRLRVCQRERFFSRSISAVAISNFACSLPIS